MDGSRSQNRGKLARSATFFAFYARAMQRALLCCMVFCLSVLCLPSSALCSPSWWTSRNVIQTNAVVEDYAPVVLGQLKWFATNACDELDAKLPGGAGSNVWDLVQSFSALSNNWLTVNVGQLKAVGTPFFDRLNGVGYTNVYPWTIATTDDVDYAIANLGQLKNVFSFDLMGGQDTDSDGLPDWWETKYFGSALSAVPSEDPDGDNLTNLQEYQNQYKTDPTKPDTDGDGMPDGWEVANGFNPLGPADASADFDGDGLSNLAEYQAGTDPLDVNSFPASLSGTITYTGSQTGQVWIVAVTSSWSWATNHGWVMSAPGSYSITNLPNLTNYWLKAWRDSTADNAADTGSEAYGEYLGNPVNLTTNTAGVNITLGDPHPTVTITFPANNSVWAVMP